MVGKDRTERSNAAEGDLGDGREHVGKFIIHLGKIVLHKDELLFGGNGAGTLYLKLVGIDSPEDVRKLSGWQIVVPRKYAKKLGKNEWYIEDLKNCALNFYPEQGDDGLAVWTAPAAGKPVTVGTITDVIEGGSGNLLEILLAEN